MKRLLDVLLSSIGLAVLAPLFVVVALAIKLDSRGPVFFRQERIGKGFAPFLIFKFRTMEDGADRKGPLITSGGDSRVTKTGRLLRRCKIDELPQLLNVLAGDMSLVGPRPEVRKYVELFESDYGELLKVRPGITDPASMQYSEEETVLSSSGDSERDYTGKILPEKIRLSLQYVRNHSVITDMAVILKTILKITGLRQPS